MQTARVSTTVSVYIALQLITTQHTNDVTVTSVRCVDEWVKSDASQV